MKPIVRDVMETFTQARENYHNQPLDCQPWNFYAWSHLKMLFSSDTARLFATIFFSQALFKTSHKKAEVFGQNSKRFVTNTTLFIIKRTPWMMCGASRTTVGCSSSNGTWGLRQSGRNFEQFKIALNVSPKPFGLARKQNKGQQQPTGTSKLYLGLIRDTWMSTSCVLTPI